MRATFDRRVIVKKAVRQSDGAGTATVVRAIRHYQLPCTITPVTGREVRTFGREAHPGEYLMYCRVVEMAQTDQVIDRSITYEVIDIRQIRRNHLYVLLGRVN